MKDVSFTGVFLIARGLILCFQERLKLKFPERFHGFSERFFGYCCFVAILYTVWGEQWSSDAILTESLMPRRTKA